MYKDHVNNLFSYYLSIVTSLRSVESRSIFQSASLNCRLFHLVQVLLLVPPSGTVYLLVLVILLPRLSFTLNLKLTPSSLSTVLTVYGFSVLIYCTPKTAVDSLNCMKFKCLIWSCIFVTVIFQQTLVDLALPRKRFYSIVVSYICCILDCFFRTLLVDLHVCLLNLLSYWHLLQYQLLLSVD